MYVRKLGYDVVGISFVLATYHRMVELAALIQLQRGKPAEAKLLLGKDMQLVQAIGDKQGIAIATQGDSEVAKLADHVIEIPPADELLLPILEIVPLQLLAYHVAVLKGTDVDQPRNLAKSATVE